MRNEHALLELMNDTGQSRAVCRSVLGGHHSGLSNGAYVTVWAAKRDLVRNAPSTSAIIELPNLVVSSIVNTLPAEAVLKGY